MHKQLKIFLGGTFNPVHLGHVHLANLAYDYFAEPIYWLPCYLPIHKDYFGVTLQHRINMLDLLIKNNNNWHLDHTEINSKTKLSSYATFSNMKYNNKCLLIGSDSLRSFSSWHDWQLLTKHIHLIVANRAFNELVIPHELTNHLYVTENKDDLYLKDSGCLFLLPEQVKIISSTKIRTCLAKKDLNSIKHMLPASILEYILINNLYLN